MAELRNSLPTGLLSDVKTYLDISFSSTQYDNKLSNLIAQGIMYLNDKFQVNEEEIDYTADGMERMLLFDYVRYSRDEALALFERDYQSLILACQHKRKVNLGAIE